MLIFAAKLYVVFSVLLHKYPTMGGMIAMQVLCFLLPAAICAKWKTGDVKAALRFSRVLKVGGSNSPGSEPALNIRWQSDEKIFSARPSGNSTPAKR